MRIIATNQGLTMGESTLLFTFNNIYLSPYSFNNIHLGFHSGDHFEPSCLPKCHNSITLYVNLKSFQIIFVPNFATGTIIS